MFFSRSRWKKGNVIRSLDEQLDYPTAVLLQEFLYLVTVLAFMPYRVEMIITNIGISSSRRS